jgi:hypothetical protein
MFGRTLASNSDESRRSLLAVAKWPFGVFVGVAIAATRQWQGSGKAAVIVKVLSLTPPGLQIKLKR